MSVGDGDTVRVTSQQGEKVTIRLAFIDAPETSQGTSGKWSTQTLKRLLRGKSIYLKPQVKDRYGRTVAEIYVGNRNINLQMVRQGAAYAYRKYLSNVTVMRTYERNPLLARKSWGSGVHTDQTSCPGNTAETDDSSSRSRTPGWFASYASLSCIGSRSL